MGLFGNKVATTVDSILAPYTKLIGELSAHKETKHAEIKASTEEIERHNTLIAAAQAEADRAHAISEKLKAAIA